MALTVVDNRTILDECDSTTGWTSTDGPSTFSTAPTPVEATLCLGLQASNAAENAYTTITAINMGLGGTLSVWFADRASFDSLANVGYGIQVGDGTNRIAYAVGGNDAVGFRYGEGPVKWSNSIIDLANKPTNFTAIAGTEANLNEAAITQVGVYFNTTAKSVGGADNCFWDIIRYAAIGVGIEVYGGTVGTPEVLSTLATIDRATGNQQAHGLFRELATGLFGCQGNVSLGDATSTNDTYIDVIDVAISFENRGLSADNYYRFGVQGNGTGTTVVTFLRATIQCATGASAALDLNDANSTIPVDDCTFVLIDQGITLQTGITSAGNTFRSCGLITLPSTTKLEGSTIQNSTSAISVTTVSLNDVTDNDFISDGSNHAVELTGSAGTYSWDNSLSGYDAGTSGNGVEVTGGSITGNEAIHITATTGTFIINVVDGATTPSVSSAGAVVNVVAGQKTFSFTVSPSITAYEWRIYSVTAIGSLAGSVELDGEESATVDNQSYSYSYTSDTPIAVQIIAQPDEDYEEAIVYFTLVNSNQDVIINLEVDNNN